MRLHISQEDASHLWIDRSGRREDHGREGFVVIIGPLTIEFEDELDAARLAVAMVGRLGCEVETVGGSPKL